MQESSFVFAMSIKMAAKLYGLKKMVSGFPKSPLEFFIEEHNDWLLRTKTD